MAALHSARNRTLDHRVLLWLTLHRVLAANPSAVAEVYVPPAGKLPAVVCPKAERPPLDAYVGDELLNVLCRRTRRDISCWSYRYSTTHQPTHK